MSSVRTLRQFFFFVISLKHLESSYSLSSSFAVIVSGSLGSSIVEQNHFRALMSDFVFLTVLNDFCAEIKYFEFLTVTVAFAFRNGFGYLSRSYSVFPPLELVHHHLPCF